jgi:hypothetical protein
MACWTFVVLIGNGRRVIVDQVTAIDLRSAYLQWARVIKIKDVTLTEEGRRAAWGLPQDIEDEFACRPDLKGVWCSVCTFDVLEEDRPEAWGNDYPVVWVIKTDIGTWLPGL